MGTTCSSYLHSPSTLGLAYLLRLYGTYSGTCALKWNCLILVSSDIKVHVQACRLWVRRLLLLPPSPAVSAAIWNAVSFLSGTSSPPLPTFVLVSGVQDLYRIALGLHASALRLLQQILFMLHGNLLTTFWLRSVVLRSSADDLSQTAAPLLHISGKQPVR